MSKQKEYADTLVSNLEKKLEEARKKKELILVREQKQEAKKKRAKDDRVKFHLGGICFYSKVGEIVLSGGVKNNALDNLDVDLITGLVLRMVKDYNSNKTDIGYLTTVRSEGRKEIDYRNTLRKEKREAAKRLASEKRGSEDSKNLIDDNKTVVNEIPTQDSGCSLPEIVHGISAQQAPAKGFNPSVFRSEV